MSSLAFVTHPSVRIKGTENSYSPTQCLDDRCPVKAPHLHCPFCVKTDAYQDPVILKAHYRVKHVDKGIEFAGLKILRCCDQCDIIGIIKGEKRFKGAHWHCYRCRNGFNRRDEAIKHYKTHFRNPQTTFQIQITQDLNSPPEVRPHDDHTTGQDAFGSIENPVQEIIHPALSQTAISLAEQNVITSAAVGSRHGNNVQKIKVKHELLGKDDSTDHGDEATIMIIQGDQLESAFASHIINSGDITALNKANTDSNLSWEIRFRLEEEEKNIYKSKAEEYKAQVELLQQRVADLEAQLAEQCQLKLHDLLDNLNAGDANKQGLGQQLTKFLEQCQLSSSQGTVTVIEDDSQCQVSHQDQLVTGESIIQDLEHNSNSLSDQLVTSGAISQHLDTNTGVTHLSEIPEGFQVICTTSEGRVVVSRAPDGVAPAAVEVAGVQSTAETAIIPAENSIISNSVAQVSVVGSEGDQQLFAHVLNHHNKDETTGVAQSDVSTFNQHQALIAESSMHQDVSSDITGVSNSHECLMEVVAAADGLASLGTDVSGSVPVTERTNEHEFTMNVEDGERILVQDMDDKSCSDVKTAEGIEIQVKEEPISKRARIT